MSNLETLNTLRLAAGKKPLKAWKESKDKLLAAIAALMPAPDNAAGVVKGFTRKVEWSEGEIGVWSQSEDGPIWEPIDRSTLTDEERERLGLNEDPTPAPSTSTPAPKSKKAKDPVKKVDIAQSDTVTLAEIAREIGMDPKNARAKFRRIDVPADYMTATHTFHAARKQWVIDALQKDFRKK